MMNGLEKAPKYLLLLIYFDTGILQVTEVIFFRNNVQVFDTVNIIAIWKDQGSFH